MNLRFASLSRAGPANNNQDCFMEPITSGDDWWCAIADGVGSSQYGAIASKICIDWLSANLSDAISMRSIFRAISDYLRTRAMEHQVHRRMSSTLSVLRLSGHDAFVGHVGDTRISQYRGGGVVTRTYDQTEVQLLIDEGVLSRYQARRYPRKHVILSAMSSHHRYELYESRFSVEKGDRILLTTDGFHQTVNRRSVAHLSSSHKDFCSFFQAIKNTVSDLTPSDDTTCLAIELE